MFSRLLLNPISFVLVTIVCLVFSLSLYKSAERARQSARELEVIEADIDAMKTELNTLEEQAKEAEQPFTKEKIIRNELLMQKPGEYVVQIPEAVKNEQKEVPSPSPSPWQEWKALLL
jgi:cell division protein FtsB